MPEITINLPPIDALKAVCAAVVVGDIPCPDVRAAAEVVAGAMRETLGVAYETMPLVGGARRCQWLLARRDSFEDLAAFRVALALAWQE